ncbi:hypothetical protein FDP41_012654 [Naegleria fowleri]|uniref:Potassium channel tetramerisation-type BTB domain-containing protein n=1 Tax=Naegleria fowleri TaxID=5763 RepID=A0A6A5BZL6_NAEFO|nr:uncharacterized protein FDP41_012654 [Naegleria fowleri]KAF0980866.1 hypothetical protein FDP41_012654 [Naegleria fowleri]
MKEELQKQRKKLEEEFTSRYQTEMSQKPIHLNVGGQFMPVSIGDLMNREREPDSLFLKMLTGDHPFYESKIFSMNGQHVDNLSGNSVSLNKVNNTTTALSTLATTITVGSGCSINTSTSDSFTFCDPSKMSTTANATPVSFNSRTTMNESNTSKLLEFNASTTTGVGFRHQSGTPATTKGEEDFKKPVTTSQGGFTFGATGVSSIEDSISLKSSKVNNNTTTTTPSALATSTISNGSFGFDSFSSNNQISTTNNATPSVFNLRTNSNGNDASTTNGDESQVKNSVPTSSLQNNGDTLKKIEMKPSTNFTFSYSKPVTTSTGGFNFGSFPTTSSISGAVNNNASVTDSNLTIPKLNIQKNNLSDEKVYFVNCNPVVFEHVLRWLRYGILNEDLDSSLLSELKVFCKVFQLKKLENEVDKAKKQLNTKREKITQKQFLKILNTSTKLSSRTSVSLNLSGLDMTGLRICNVNMSGSDIVDSLLSYAVLENSNLSGSNLSNTSFDDASLENVNLSGSNLTKTRFFFASLEKVNFSKCNLKECIFGYTQKMVECDFSDVTNLDSLWKATRRFDVESWVFSNIVWLVDHNDTTDKTFSNSTFSNIQSSKRCLVD